MISAYNGPDDNWTFSANINDQGNTSWSVLGKQEGEDENTIVNVTAGVVNTLYSFFGIKIGTLSRSIMNNIHTTIEPARYTMLTPEWQENYNADALPHGITPSTTIREMKMTSMKTLISIILIGIFITPIHAQSTSKNQGGSWINGNIADYYVKEQKDGCNIKDFDNNKFIPLSICFKSHTELVMVLRIEQGVAYYTANYAHGKLVSISNGRNTYKVEQNNNTIVLHYRGNLIPFRKVADHFSNDVFTELITNLIFNKQDSLRLRILKSNKSIEVTKSNMVEKLRVVFKCDLIEAVQLGTFKDRERCLPEIVAYHKVNQLSSPQTFGVLIDPDKVTFIDNSMNPIAILK